VQEKSGLERLYPIDTNTFLEAMLVAQQANQNHQHLAAQVSKPARR
jgi:hypothetical protein